MYKDKKIISFIGARSGSKGLENKNIIDFAGKPLINWTIEASLKSRYIDYTVVSTDSDVIAEIARSAGAQVPFMRPSNISGDDAPLLDAVKHCLGWIGENTDHLFDYIILLQPTLPLRTVDCIDQGVEYYFSNMKEVTDTMVSVIQLPEKYGYVMREDEKGYANFCFDVKSYNMRRQDMSKYYLPNGAVYFGKVQTVLEEGFYTEQTLLFPMNASVSVDIDSKDDLDKALKLFNRK